MHGTLTALKALSDQTRLRIVALLARGELTVSEIVDVLGQSQPRVSRHLKLLCDAQLLTRFQEATWVFYRLSREPGVFSLLSSVLANMNSEDPVLASDQAGLDTIRARRRDEAQNYFRQNASSWDAIRALHVPESEVEDAILSLCGDIGGAHLLDIGTGTGRMLELMAPHIASGLGIDLSRDMLALARSALLARGYAHCEVRQGDMYALTLDSDSMDRVILHQVLHFADDPEQVIREAARVLKPGGRFVIADFAPHDREDLRTSHQHRRLGFSVVEIGGWCVAMGLREQETIRLEGGDLSVSLWSFDKPVGRQPQHPSVSKDHV